MKLGSQTGSLTNHLYSRMVIGQPIPEIGMGVTMMGWTDRYAGTIVEILKGGKYITVRTDTAKRVDKNGMSECQEYEYTPNPDGALYYFKKNKDGCWVEGNVNPATGRFKQCQGGGRGLRLNERRAYHDYSF